MDTGQLSGKPDEMLGVTCNGQASCLEVAGKTLSPFMLQKPG